MELTISSVLLLLLPLVMAALPPAPSCPTNVTLPVLDPVTLAWAASLSGSKQISEMTIPEARVASDLIAVAGNVSNPSDTKITTKILHLPVGPTGNVTVYLYKPESGDREEYRDQEQDLLPVVVYFHGLFILAPME